jgi:hypothetical protein
MLTGMQLKDSPCGALHLLSVRNGVRQMTELDRRTLIEKSVGTEFVWTRLGFSSEVQMNRLLSFKNFSCDVQQNYDNPDSLLIYEPYYYSLPVILSKQGIASGT